ncbi:hypothetical protein [Sulfitobacter sp. 915]|uniref:hypothetical protein n=1 Tax=Sulfitobacter sp. 915 TaxID=3368558 RepID=UPI003746310A
MLIRSADLKGSIPRLHPRLLPSNYAQVARNTRLEDGSIGPIKAPITAHTFGTAPATFLKWNGNFVSFDQEDVYATPGPVAQDRLYFMGDGGAPKMRVGGTDYALALYAPSLAATVTRVTQDVGNAPSLATVYVNPQDPELPPETFDYRYSAITEKGETIASPSADIVRVDGERVVLSNMVLPEGTLKIRVYRLDRSRPSGAAGRFGLLLEQNYVAGTHGPLNSASITDFFSVFPDVSKAPFEDGDYAATEEVVTYTYTYVTEFDEESAPAPASTLLKIGKTDAATFSVSAPGQSGRGIDRIRVYRSKTSLAGTTDFYFLTELTVGQAGSVQEDDFNQLLNEPIPSTDYNPPEDDARGLIPLPNGLMAAFRGRELMFCEPYKPHAWPIKYRMTTDTDIVGLGAFGTFVAVLTKGTPFMVQGSDPSLMIMEKLESTLPCLNDASIVDMGYSVAYASYEGLVVVSQRGAEVVSRRLFTEEQWRAMRPQSIRASQRGGRYHFTYQPVANGPRKFGIIDLSGEQPFFIEADIEPTLLYFDPDTGSLYYIEGDAVVKEFDPRNGATIEKQSWRGRRIVLPGYDNFGAILVETDDVAGTKATPTDPDCTIRIYADGNLVHTTTDINFATRLPSGFTADKWEIEIEGYAAVTGISLASDIAELVGN